MKIHLTAIGGTGMGALAGLLVDAGHEVRGSDGPLYPPMSTLLAELQIPVFEDYASTNLDWGPDVVVVGNTCRTDNVELVAARARDLRVASFPQLLREMFLEKRHPVVVAGTHGKTTTSSLMAHVLINAGLAPGYLIGGIPLNFGRSFAIGDPPHFVVEGDEYHSACFDRRPKFVHYRPQTVILTGVELDHADIYSSMDELERAFAVLVQSVPAEGRIVVSADSEIALRLCGQASCPVISYAARSMGADEIATPRPDWLGRFEPLGGGKQRLTLYEGSRVYATIDIALTGAHNMANCVAVATVAAQLGLSPTAIAAGLSSFAGVRRRQELRGVVDGVAVIDDFAHHPTAIRETLDGLRGVHGDGRLVAVFEPRSSTSRRNVFQTELAEALAHADEAIVAPLFAPEKIDPEQRLDRQRLIADVTTRGVEAHGPSDVEAIVSHLARSAAPGDTVVVMSSGGFEGLPLRLLAALQERTA